MRIAFIGSAGLPNKYGGFESFVDNCAPEIVKMNHSVTVTCDKFLYPGEGNMYKGVNRLFVGVRANGGWSILHDLVAFLMVVIKNDCVVVLGVSGGFWFPFFRITCDILGKKLLVNLDGIEWRRDKFTPSKRFILRLFDGLAQIFSHGIIYDNNGLADFLIFNYIKKSTCIPYSGDHVFVPNNVQVEIGHALTVCRIEPENNLEMLINGFLISKLKKYTIIGNWNHSKYSKSLREKYSGNERIELLDPIYDPVALAEYRKRCEFYLHGHSVGGTNPSLVEMLFYDCNIFCYDVNFNRYTAGDAALYFSDASSLAVLCDGTLSDSGSRNNAREKYTAINISNMYIKFIESMS